jgi:cytochrome c biogenesis protein ResB
MADRTPLMKRFLRLLGSRGFAIALLVVSIVVLIFWRGNPDYYSPVFLVVPAFIFLSISVCIAKRLKGRTSKDARFWGSFIFHIGMLVVIATTTFGTLTGFFGRTFLPEGVSVPLGNNDLSTITRSSFDPEETPFMTLRLDDFTVTYLEERFPVRYAAAITFGILMKDNYRIIKESVEINRPFDYEGYRFLLEDGGYSPRVILKTKDGKTLYDSFVRLENETKIEDVFELRGTDLIIQSRFFPDFYKKDGLVGTRSPILKNPAFGIKVNRKRQGSGIIIWKGVLKVGEEAEFAGMTLEFHELRPYVVLLVVNDPTTPWLLGGWVLIVVGLVIRYFPAIRIRGTADDVS